MDAPSMSSYLQYLPAALQQGDFLGRFLLAFEAVLSGLDLKAVGPLRPTQEEAERHRLGLALPVGFETQEQLVGLEQLLDRIHEFFDPTRTPEDFLPWLAQWVAVSLREDWSEATRRAFISQIVPLYRMRGTRAGIEAVLRLSGDEAKVVDFNDGLDEALETESFGPGEKPPHFFGVILTVNERDPALLSRKVRRVRAIVEREKPAHTYYGLRVKYPAMRIMNTPTPSERGIIVGETTVLGTQKVEKDKM